MNIKWPVFVTGIWVVFSYTPVGKQTFNFGNLLFTWEENGLQQLTSDRNILLSLLTYITESLFSATAGGIVFRSSVCFPQCLWTSLSLVFYRFDKICFCVSPRLKAHLFHQLWKCFQLFSNVSLTFCSLTQILLLALNSQSQVLSLWDSLCFYWPVLQPHFYAFNSVYHTSDVFITFSIFYPHTFLYFLHTVLHGISKHFTHLSFDNLPYLPTHFTCMWYTSDSSTWISTRSNFTHFTVFADLPWGCLVPYGRLFVFNYEVIHTRYLCMGFQQTLKYSELLNKCTARRTSIAEFLGCFYFS